MNEQDPPRLRDGGGELGRLLRGAHEDLPDHREMSRIAAQLHSPVAWSASLAVKLSAGLGVVAAIAGLSALQAHREPAPPAVVSMEIPSSSASVPEQAPVSSRASVIPTPEDTSSGAPVEPSAQRVLPRATAARSAEAEEDPMADLALLEQARRKSNSSPAEALTLVNEHARRFPRSSMALEREVIRIEALARSGRQGEAQDRARRLLSSSPRSVYRERLERLIR